MNPRISIIATLAALPQIVTVAVVFALLVLTLAPAVRGQSNSVPFINQPLVPDAVAPGGPAFSLIVNGTGFVSGATVNWNGSPRSTTFVSDSQLTAQISAGDIATPRTANVTVTNQSGIASNSMLLQVAPPATSVNFARSDVPVGAEPISVASGDFNGDGRPDLAITNYQSPFMTILLGNGDGTLTPAPTVPVALGLSSVATGDFNGDGKTDLVSVDAFYSTVTVILGNGDGTFQNPMTFSYGHIPFYLAVADFNADGKLDLALVNGDASGVSILLGNGDGTFQNAMTFSVGGLSNGIAVGDLNSDGHLDLVTGGPGDAISVLLGNGDGTFQSPVSFPSGDAQGVIVADLNGDGKLDTIATVLGPNGVNILLGNGDGTFQPAAYYPTDGVIYAPTVGDFNRDFKLQIALIGPNGGLILLPGNGDGTFQPPAAFPAFALGSGMATGDFNGDGLLDLALTNYDGNTVSIALQTTLVVSSPSINFGSQGVLTTSAQNLRLTNIGSAAIPINSITITGANADVFGETSACGTSLAAGASCSLSVSFTPKNERAFTATLNIFDGAVGSPQQILLSGTGEFARTLISPGSLHFGNQTVGTTSNPQSVKLSVRNFALRVTSISFTGTYASDFAQTNDCTPVVPANSFCKITVTFTPSGAGARSVKLFFEGGFEGGHTYIPVNGTGVN